MSAFTPVSWLSERSSLKIYSACDLPMPIGTVVRKHFSLTVARQRGILTRFPVSGERRKRANEKFGKNTRSVANFDCKENQGQCQ